MLHQMASLALHVYCAEGGAVRGLQYRPALQLLAKNNL